MKPPHIGRNGSESPELSLIADESLEGLFLRLINERFFPIPSAHAILTLFGIIYHFTISGIDN